MNNKKAIITLVTLLWLPCSLFGLQFDHSEEAIMGGQYETPTDWFGPIRRSPTPIKFTQEGHRLVFASSYVGAVVEVCDGETFLYTGAIGEDGSVLIPESIEGEVELIVTKDRKTYHTMIEL